MGELRAEQAKEDSLLPVGPRGGGQSAHGTENREAWGPHSFIGSSIPVLLQYLTVPRRQAVLGAGTMAGMAGSARGSPPGSAHCSPERRERHPRGVRSTICSVCDSLGMTEPLPSRGGCGHTAEPAVGTQEQHTPRLGGSEPRLNCE